MSYHHAGHVVAFYLLCLGLVAWAACGALHESGQAAQFDGTWRLVDEGGKTAAWLKVSGSFAERRHAPGIACRVTRSGKDLRMAWADGFRDVIRLTGSGAELLALPRWSESWEDEPRFRLTALRKM